ncbi:hypothetical protein BDP27DRAFT_511727 [Rhodocollybia butyracea]|uniref:Heterokaryon incompatibility domain-containing protein n=1 Tax=Rhodocollybia butyracea TaxID=206335 RepID=A0A9P5PX66_9AGAR|nr:hypothetical protein BDP27DRAFT_511727 [Rhodocollybia butyracea]
MRLLRTTSRDPELVYYADEQGIPLYAILSHPWEEEEVTFQYIHDLSTAKNMKGYSKIMRVCELARSDDYKYIWIDTCCIDKSSSAELSEAINSMYGYYREAEVCYAYLADVQSNLPRQLFETAFCECKWFTRGWTLQELLAPMTVIFFARDWKEIGTKASLQGIITNITGIPPQVLLMNGAGEISIAKRMSWGAGRKTTRIEDKAYSLMGTDGFGVFMPTIYGEGPNAFTRLQEEILKVSDDQTIFAWKANTQSVVSGGLLATSPDDFGESGGYERFDRPDTRRPYSMTNLGLQIRLPLIPRNRHDEFLALLNCRQQGTLEYLAIYVKRSHVSDGHQFARMHPNVLVPCREKGSPQELFFKERDPARFEVGEWVRCSSQYQISFFFPGEVILQQKYSPTPASWTDHDTDKNIVYLHFPGSGSSGALLFRDNQFNQPFIVMAGVHNYNIWLDTVLDFDKNKPIDLEDVQGSYYRDNGRGGMLWKNLDRTSKHLTNNKAILVEARRKGTNNRGDPPYHMVNIRIVDRMHPDVPPAILEHLSMHSTYPFQMRRTLGSPYWKHTLTIFGKCRVTTPKVFS